MDYKCNVAKNCRLFAVSFLVTIVLVMHTNAALQSDSKNSEQGTEEGKGKENKAEAEETRKRILVDLSADKYKVRAAALEEAMALSKSEREALVKQISTMDNDQLKAAMRQLELSLFSFKVFSKDPVQGAVPFSGLISSEAARTEVLAVAPDSLKKFIEETDLNTHVIFVCSYKTTETLEAKYNKSRDGLHIKLQPKPIFGLAPRVPHSEYIAVAATRNLPRITIERAGEYPMSRSYRPPNMPDTRTPEEAAIDFVRSFKPYQILNKKEIMALEYLAVDDATLTLDEVSLLKHLPKLKGFSNRGGRLTPEHCKILSKLSLEVLDVAMSPIQGLGRASRGGAVAFNNDSLAALSGSPVKSLHLGGVNITDKGLKHLKDLPHLREVNLNGIKVEEEGLKILHSIETLRSLTLTCSANTLPSFNPNLTHLSVYFLCRKDNKAHYKFFSALGELESLQSLTVYSGVPLEEQHLKSLLPIQGLTSLILKSGYQNKLSEAALGMIASHTKLEELSLGYFQFNTTKLDKLAGLKLRKLDIRSNKLLDDSGIKSIAKMFPDLEVLNLRYCKGLTLNCLADLSKLTNLEKLNTCSTKLHDADGIYYLPPSKPKFFIEDHPFSNTRIRNETGTSGFESRSKQHNLRTQIWSPDLIEE